MCGDTLISFAGRFFVLIDSSDSSQIASILETLAFKTVVEFHVLFSDRPRCHLNWSFSCHRQSQGPAFV